MYVRMYAYLKLLTHWHLHSSMVFYQNSYATAERTKYLTRLKIQIFINGLFSQILLLLTVHYFPTKFFMHIFPGQTGLVTPCSHKKTTLNILNTYD